MRVIPNEKLFSLWARLTGADKKIQWGTYRFDASLPPQEVLQRLVIGKRVFLTVTIPEGLTIKEIGELLARMQIADREKFLADHCRPRVIGNSWATGQRIGGLLISEHVSICANDFGEGDYCDDGGAVPQSV